jgi:hypothetical protein
MTSRPYEFPQSRVESTGGGPDFPGPAGDRERGKFRPSGTPRLTSVAVAADDGRPVARTTDQILEDILLYQRAILLGLSLMTKGESFEPADVLDQG